jgi:hypothetical protein
MGTKFQKGTFLSLKMQQFRINFIRSRKKVTKFKLKCPLVFTSLRSRTHVIKNILVITHKPLQVSSGENEYFSGEKTYTKSKIEVKSFLENLIFMEKINQLTNTYTARIHACCGSRSALIRLSWILIGNADPDLEVRKLTKTYK